MSNHTLGPWKIVDSWEDHTIEGPKGEEIIFQDGPYQTPSIKEANARLIAAAPDLLEALIDMVQAYSELIPRDQIPPSRGRQAIRKASSAIAKAKGETK